MKKQKNYSNSLLLYVWMLFYTQSSLFSQVLPSITVGIDTTNIEIKEVYDLYTNYINSKPDSIYLNPYWDEVETKRYVSKEVQCDKSAWIMFNTISSSDFFNAYPPKIISIIKLDHNKYSLRILFSNSTEGYEKFNPVYIVKLFAVHDKKGVFKLKNMEEFETKDWRRHNYKNISYVVSSNAIFNKKDAKKAVTFYKNKVKLFNLKNSPPITYYITDNYEDMGRLFNFEFWLSYTTGITNTYTEEIYTALGNSNFPHELVHLLLSSEHNSNENFTILINEGIATWLGGPNYNETYEAALTKFSKEIKKNDSLTIEKIVQNKYRHQFDNKPLYITGAVICEQVFIEKGIEGVKKMLGLSFDELKLYLSTVFNKSFEEVDRMVMNYIKNYTS